MNDVRVSLPSQHHGDPILVAAAVLVTGVKRMKEVNDKKSFTDE